MKPSLPSWASGVCLVKVLSDCEPEEPRHDGQHKSPFRVSDLSSIATPKTADKPPGKRGMSTTSDANGELADRGGCS